MLFTKRNENWTCSQATYLVLIYPGSCVDIISSTALGALNLLLLPFMSVGKDNNILLTTRQKIIKSSQGANDQAEGLAGAELYGWKEDKSVKGIHDFF